MSTRDRRLWEKGFTDGYVCAVANIIRTHGETTIAKDVLGGCEPTKRQWCSIEPYDRDLLAEHGLAPKRRKTRSAPRGAKETNEHE